MRTVVVRLSRKLTATYRLRSGHWLPRLLLAMLANLSTQAMALPTEMSVVAGQATVSTPSANAMVVTQGSSKAILNWQSFNIGVGQSVQFVQPSAASVALNRVIGQDPSAIYGSLSANGQVFLINPAGVMFAPGAQVNVGGLVASTLSLSNEDFSAGRYIFNQSGNVGSVVNHGSIQAARGGYVLLAASNVSNTGTISTEAGSVGLAAGSRVTLDPSGVGLVRFSVDAAAVKAVVANSGVVAAEGGQVAMLASALGDAMATVVNQTGVIRATSATERNGMIVLSGGASGVVRVAGTLDVSGTAPGQSGGTVKVLGDKVALEFGARIDASGQVGGGTVLVGGNYQGKGPEQNAALTVVAPDASIDASAISSGDGGKVVVWADEVTGFYGAVKATGGALGGNGGLVEVSGKQTLAFDGSADLSAAKGQAGTLLLDPLNIVVSSSGPAAYADVSTFAAQSGSTQTVSIGTLNAVAGNILLQASNDITLSSAFTVTAGKSVSFEANNNININAALSTSGVGAINLKADADASGAGTVALGAAVTAQAGGVTLSGASVTSTAAGTLSATGAASSNAGNVQVTASGVVNLAGAITASGGTAGAGTAGKNGGTVTITGVGVTTAAITASGSAGNGSGQAGGAGGTISVTSTGGVTTAALAASGGAGGSGNAAGGNAGSISVSNSGSGNIVTTTLAAQTGNAVGSGAGGTAGSISVSNTAGNLTTGAITTTGGTSGDGGNVSVTAASGTVSMGAISTTGGTATTGNAGRKAGSVTLSGAGVTTAAISAIGSNASTLGAGGNGGTVSVSSTGALSVAGAISATGGNGAGGQLAGTGGAVSLTASGGNVTLAGNVTTNNTVSIDAGTGTYTQNTNVDVSAGTGAITVIADTVAIGTNTGGNALTTSGTLTLKAKTASRDMSLAGSSAFDISSAEITAISTGATGAIVVGDAASTGALTVGAAVNLAGKTLTLNAGSITDVGVKTITASNLTLNANGQIGSDSANGIDVAVSNLSVNTTGNANAFVRSGAVNLGASGNGSNLGTGTLDLVATGNVTQTAATGNITAGTVRVKTLSAGTASITLTNSGNDVAAIDLKARNAGDTANAAGALQYSDANGFDAAALATTGNATLSAGAAVSQSGAVAANGLALTGTGGAYTLRHAGNAVSTLAASTGSVDYSQAGALSVGTVGVAGVTTTGRAKIETTGLASSLTLNAAVTSSGSGDAVVLKAGSSNAAGVATGGQLVNNVGAGGIQASNGRYLVYSGDPGTTLEGVSGYSKRYNSDAGYQPGGSDNMFLYRVAPTLTITTDNTTRVYGQANPVFTGTASGFIDGDTAASVGVTRTTTAVFNTPVAAGPVAITAGATNKENYTLALSHGTMSITPATISEVTGITARNKMVNGNTSATLNTEAAGFVGIVAGDVLSVPTATGTFDSPAVGSGKTVFIQGITLGGAAAGNYILAKSTATTQASITDLSSVSGNLQQPAGVPSAPVASLPASSVADSGPLVTIARGGGGDWGVASVPSGGEAAPGLSFWPLELLDLSALPATAAGVLRPPVPAGSNETGGPPPLRQEYEPLDIDAGW